MALPPTEPGEPDPPDRSRPLFAALVVAEVLVALWLVAGHRVVCGHDGFQYASLQYYFLNDRVISGEVPQWLPFMTQGTVANWWYAVQGGLLQSALLATGLPAVLGGANAIFHLGVLVDRLLLLVGVWLLGGVLYRSGTTRAFVAGTVVWTSVWATQPWYNLHFFYLLPLVFYLTHRFLDTARWGFFALAVNLVAMQALGSLPYLLPVTSFVAFLYGVLVAVARLPELRGRWREFVPGARDLGLVALAALPLAAVWGVLSHGTEAIANYNPGRSLEMTTTLDGYLGYARNQDFAKWLELLLGVSPALDYTLFIGYLPLPLALVALGAIDRKSAPVLAALVVILLASIGSPVAVALYFAWPMMHYFRHLALLAVLAKLFLCLLAGVGFDAWLAGPGARAPRPVPGAGVAALGLGAVGLGLLAFCRASEPVRAVFAWMIEVDRGLPMVDLADLPVLVLRGRMAEAALVALLTGAALAWWGRTSDPATRRRAAAWLLGLHAIGLGLYQVHELRLRTGVVPEAERGILEFQPMPFPMRRTIGLPGEVRRLDLLQRLPGPYVLYWSTQSFLFVDEAGSTWRVDHWLWPLDRFLRTYWGQDPLDRTVPPAGMFPYDRLDFPAGHPGGLAAAGVREDKLQVFAVARREADDRAVSARMRRADWTGGNLFLSGADPDLPGEPACLPAEQAPGARHDRIEVRPEVVRFSSNQLLVRVAAPADRPAWLYYADVWHPGWTATVDGVPTRVHRANLAYKAVQLHPGTNEVLFRFELPLLTWLMRVLGWLSLAWVAAGAGLVVVLLRGGDAPGGPAGGAAR